ncbi:thioredoxin family protein [Thiorhodococcus minor]|uniref:Thioredoxin fold domain-containing protein n=1 Tax=Thiorhodococcus minor TaxID=57489 RepID=A0A6M0JWQ5_9GAMM|nr:thioredoxin fold domain-containing protein [Thiorhodococcus minor]NEV61940.1 thioredoxin fold domain-containing protein [Thiorhodococcus minor]
MPFIVLLTPLLLALALGTSPAAGAADTSQADQGALDFDDFPREEILHYPSWFKQSFLDIPADLEEAVAADKQGLMVYFGQKRCSYCHQLIKVNFGLQDIVEYARRHFDLVPIDIWGVDEVTTLSGEVVSERQWSRAQEMDFTPAILFIDADGEVALRLRGYYPPYQFRAALEYVADGHYKRESFRDYLARGENRMVFDAEDMNDEPFFAPPPYNLDRRFPAKRPLAVFFEQGNCHPCDVLHGQVLRTAAINRRFDEFDSVQLDMWSDTPIVTPAGERTTARQWAAELGLFYAPAILFFDERGREVLRLDSVIGFYRLRNALSYIVSKAYLTESFGDWRISRVF